jgi:hypothetical protein
MKSNISNLAILTLILNCLFSISLLAETIEEKWPNGKTLKKYTTDDEKKKSGTYTEFHENGQSKIKAFYKKDLLEGFYAEFTEEGKKRIEAQYSKGLMNGVHRVYDKGLMTKDEIWINGVLAYPRTIQEINRNLAAIPKLKTEFVGEWPSDFKIERFSKSVEADNITGMIKLREFRYICGVPYEDMQINRKFVAHNLDAAILLNKLGRLDHTPANPGLPEDVYKSGYAGTSQSNLAGGGRGTSAAKSVEMYMNDSDNSNIDRVGHRRYCISPYMKMTGFGSEGNFSAMWSFDKSREKVEDFDYICYPARGYMPSTHFNSSYAWNVSLNPQLYMTPDKATVNVHISLLKGSIKNELKISYQNIETSGFGINNSIIFKPDSISTSPKTKYHVLIAGLKDKSGKDTQIEYFVEFF